MKFYVTGDTHGMFSERIEAFRQITTSPHDALIILGDAGFNYYGDRRDDYTKQSVGDTKIYCLHGNHEERAWNLSDYDEIFDENVNGWVWVDTKYPNIRFFNDLTRYVLNGYACLVIGGACSVDKEYRLLRGLRWFPEEQLPKSAMREFGDVIEWIAPEYDFILSHTCPLSFQPRHLFLPLIDQSKVDNTMEVWMDDIKDKMGWKKWWFGHYHDNWNYDRDVEMFFEDIKELKI